MSAPEAAYFPAFEDRCGDPEDPGRNRLELELRALRARVHFLEARCQALEGQRPAPNKLTAEQIARPPTGQLGSTLPEASTCWAAMSFSDTPP